MKKQRRFRSIKGKKNNSYRHKTAPPSIRHKASKGTGYNRVKEKKEFDSILEENNEDLT